MEDASLLILRMKGEQQTRKDLRIQYRPTIKSMPQDFKRKFKYYLSFLSSKLYKKPNMCKVYIMIVLLSLTWSDNSELGTTR